MLMNLTWKDSGRLSKHIFPPFIVPNLLLMIHIANLNYLLQVCWRIHPQEHFWQNPPRIQLKPGRCTY